MIAAERATVGTLRVADPFGDPVVVRSRLELVLGDVDLRPPGLPAAAVLVVRRLSDPSPGRLRLEAGEVRPPPEWSAALQGELASLLRRAARPAREAVGAGADAVLFADRSELLACLASDWLAGAAAARWWWRGPLDGCDVRSSRAVARTFEENVRWVPAALDRLAARGEASAFVALLEPGEAEEVARRTAAAFGAEGLLLLLEAAPRRDVNDRPVPPAEYRSEHTDASFRSAAAVRLTHAALAVASQARDEQLAPAARALLVLGLVLTRRPALARQVEALQVRDGQPRLAERPAAHKDCARETLRSRPPPASVPALGGPDPDESPGPTGSLSAERSASRLEGSPVRRRAAPGEEASVQSSSRQLPDPPPRRKPAAASRNGRTFAAQRPAEHPVLVPPDPAGLLQPELPSGTPLAGMVETELGGLFHLLNLALHLDLYGDFSRPAHRMVDLDPWDLVSLLGERLLGPTGAPADPVWALLARLAQREPGAPLGADDLVPGSWRVAAAWLEPFADADGPWRWGVRRGRLIVTHPAGFSVVDASLGGRRRRAALAEELAPLGPRRLRRSYVRPPARSWLDHLAAYSGVRLSRALGVDGPEVAVSLLLRRRARIWTTPVDVDVEFALSDLPLEVRLAGLDRDPGWVPAARHHVRYRFV